MKKNLFLLLLIFSISIYAQEKGVWVKGKASVFGSDFIKMQIDAVKRARADALNQAGIVVSASSYRVQTETNKAMNDYYSQFTEATSRGIIIKERNIEISDPVRVSKASTNDERIFQIDAELEALVIIPKGSPDPGFSLRVQTKRMSYRETDPVQLEISATKDGYVTIFHVKNDTIQITFPNGLSKNNKIQANRKLYFPSDYELYLTIDDNEKTSNEEFIVVVTKEEFPMMEIGDVKFAGDELILPKLTLTELSRWLSEIPLNQRAMDHKVLTVVK